MKEPSPGKVAAEHFRHKNSKSKAFVYLSMSLESWVETVICPFLEGVLAWENHNAICVRLEALVGEQILTGTLAVFSLRHSQPQALVGRWDWSWRC